jgi:hypothetical protein
MHFTIVHGLSTATNLVMEAQSFLLDKSLAQENLRRQYMKYLEKLHKQQ